LKEGALNDSAWIDDALRRFETPLVLYARKICGDEDRARDVVQETFLELCAAERNAVEPRLAAWLFSVCRNKALDVRRKESSMKTEGAMSVGERTGDAPDPSAVLLAEEQSERVLTLVERLPAKQQEVLRLKFQGGLSYKEIAAVTGDSVGNVGFLLHVALRALRERMSVKGEVA
jgi:RNA polymerase sigma-70 factor (ECF subfamily)